MDGNYSPEEPIAAIATALSPSAIAVVRVSGGGSVERVSRIFSNPKKLNSAAGNTIVHGWIQDLDERKIDEVLVSVFRAPRSFTGEEMAEIGCHGGVSVVKSVFDLLLKIGFRRAERGEFTFRAFLNGKADLTRAEAVREIIDSRTDGARTRAAERLSGGLFDEIDSVKKLIVDTLAEIEVEIEYPEDEETISDSFSPEKIRKAEKILENLASTWKSEKIFQDGAKVVLCGMTNAGKSSLFNALLKEDRAIVSEVEGTTRDFLESWVDFDGIPVRLFDTAGLRDTDDRIEARGVEIAQNLAGGADLVLYLVDSVSGLCEDDIQFINESKLKNDPAPIVLVFTKIDANPRWLSRQSRIETTNIADRQVVLNHRVIDDLPKIGVSSKTGEGIALLSSAVRGLLLGSGDSAENSVSLGSERQKKAVQAALESVSHSLSALNGFSLDAVVQDLEDALENLGEVTGEVTADDVLESIFSRFCVGK